MNTNEIVEEINFSVFTEFKIYLNIYYVVTKSNTKIEILFKLKIAGWTYAK